MTQHTVVSKAQWLAARRELLRKEKEFTKLRDELSRARRELPWERVEKSYVFDGASGPVSLADLFDGRSQLLVYHFMFAPDWQAGCKSCSFWADQFDGMIPHLRQRDANLVAISRAPLAALQAFAKRMGWHFPWVSSLANEFNYDFEVSARPEELAAGTMRYNYAAHPARMSELPGLSVFHRDASGSLFHTYSCYARGLDMLNATYQHLDLLPKGRDEAGLPYSMAWVKLHDQYESS